MTATQWISTLIDEMNPHLIIGLLSPQSQINFPPYLNVFPGVIGHRPYNRCHLYSRFRIHERVALERQLL